MALGGALGLGLGASDAAAFRMARVAQTHIYRELRGRRGTDGTGWRAWSWFRRPWRRGILRGRRGTNSHLPSFFRGRRGRGALGLGLGARDAAAFCVAGAAHTHTYRHFAWLLPIHTGWLTHVCTGWPAWSWFRRPWCRGILRSRRGTKSHPPSFCVAGVAPTHIDRRFAWQAWYRWHWVARLVLV